MSNSDMESPPSFSTGSELPPISEDSGLLLSSGSFSSDSASGWHHGLSELQESDCDEKSLSYGESSEASDQITGDKYNTVKKGKQIMTTIEPPPQFQDNPILFTITRSKSVDIPDNQSVNECKKYIKLAALEIPVPGRNISPLYAKKLKQECLYERRQCFSPRYLSSPGRGSLGSRISSSHNSLATQMQADDSSFITQAISHDALSASAAVDDAAPHIPDLYNVPFDSDIYALPVDSLTHHNMFRTRGKRPQRTQKKKKNTLVSSDTTMDAVRNNQSRDSIIIRHKEIKPKRNGLHSCGSKKTISESDSDALHITLRKYLHTLYSSSSDSEGKSTTKRKNTTNNKIEVHSKYGKHLSKKSELKDDIEHKNIENNNNFKNIIKPIGLYPKNKKDKEEVVKETQEDGKEESSKARVGKKSKLSPVRFLSLNLKASFCNLFRWRRKEDAEPAESEVSVCAPAARRALPPLPPPYPHQPHNDKKTDDQNATDFATSIHKVKDCGWYWGPISVEAAEEILSNEPDGSFIVRDSSDDHYIFTLTFKLNGLRHVRIEHDQGNFCFGGCTMFKAQTIVEFIENAVETSRSGRYLFFLNLRPLLGPVRVQLLYPVSRFKRVQSLQHMCRFVILKYVRRDLVSKLPLPRRLLDYLSATHYYSELLSEL